VGGHLTFNFRSVAGGPTAGAVAGTRSSFSLASIRRIPAPAGECIRDAGVPDGAFKLCHGRRATIGQELIENAQVDGIPYRLVRCGYAHLQDLRHGQNIAPVHRGDGRQESRHRHRQKPTSMRPPQASCARPLVCKARSARPARASTSRTGEEKFVDKLLTLTNKIAIGDPTKRENWLGPVANKSSYRDYADFSEELSQGGRDLTAASSARRRVGKGYFCAPTLAYLPTIHRLWKHEMFLPITTITGYDDFNAALRLANDATMADRRHLRRKKEAPSSST